MSQSLIISSVNSSELEVLAQVYYDIASPVGSNGAVGIDRHDMLRRMGLEIYLSLLSLTRSFVPFSNAQLQSMES